MGPIIDGWFVFVVAVAGWLNRDQNKVVEHLLAENAVLKEQLKDQRRLRFNVASVLPGPGSGRSRARPEAAQGRRGFRARPPITGWCALPGWRPELRPDDLMRWCWSLPASPRPEHCRAGRRG
jgi:hypothetical protein